MAYSKTNWQNLPNQTTPINSSNLNKIENGIADSYNSIGVDAYSNSSTYAVGDYCIYNNTLYRCTTAIASAEEWTLAHWTATTIKNAIKVTDVLATIDYPTTENVNVPNTTNTNVATVTIPAGETWLLIATVQFSQNSTGFRQIGIALNSSSGNQDRHSLVKQQAVSSTHTDVQIVGVRAPLNNTTYYVNVYQNSGSTLTATPGLICIRLK